MKSPLKYHGGKRYLAGRIVALMPPHTHYVEPFAGGLSVLLAHSGENRSEVVNDLDGELTNFWRVLADPVAYPHFERAAQATPFSEAVWEDARYVLRGDTLDVPAAVAFFVRVRQSLAGRGKHFAPLSRNRIRGGMNEQAAAWLSAVDRLPEVHARLRRVVILNRDALDVIRRQDGPGTLFYLDPPYLPDTRSSPDVYAHEMTTAQHSELCDVIRGCEGRVILSGYPNLLYRQTLEEAGWRRIDFDLANHAAGGAEKRRMTECVWCNFDPPAIDS